MLDWTIELAYRAGAILRAGLEKERSVELKGRGNMVTDIDHASEDLIVSAIRSHFPDHRIVAEEGGGIDQSSTYTWLIDPLDGTNNYAHGFPFFAVSLAVLEHGEPYIGVIYDPLRDELFSAQRGQGARCNGRRLHVSTTAKLDQAFLTTGFPYDRFVDSNNNLAEFQRLLLRAGDVRRPGSAALDLCYVAAGRSDGYWEMKLNPWDTAAGILMVQEAGGKLSDWQGEPLDVWTNRVVASNGFIHQELIDVLNES